MTNFSDLEKIAEEAAMEIQRAEVKHGQNAMTSLKLDVGRRLGILGEEFGEVCRATTYDNGDYDNLRKELIQTAAMAIAWVAAMDKEKAWAAGWAAAMEKEKA